VVYVWLKVIVAGYVWEWYIHATWNAGDYMTIRKEVHIVTNSLAMKLRVLRAERRLSLREASKKTGVDKVSLSRFERGLAHPQDRTLGKLAAGYGVPVRELLELEEPTLAGSTPEAEAPGPGARQGDVQEIPESLKELLERSGAATRHLADANLSETLNAVDLEDARQITRETLAEYNAVLEELARLEERFPHATTKITRLLGEAVKQLMIARWALRVRTGARLVRVEPTFPTESGEAVPEIEELDRALAMAAS